MMSYKLFVLDYSLEDLVPVVSFRTELTMQMDGHGADISLGTFFPKSDSRQVISEEVYTSGIFSHQIQINEGNRISSWNAENVSGSNTVTYSFSAELKGVRYKIPENLEIPRSYPVSMNKYLQPAEGVQMNDPLIIKRTEDILKGSSLKVKDVLTRFHRHLQDDLKNKNFSGFTDALTALKLGEASCNGKGRLFVAMARRMNLPARLVGGLILENTSKRVSHQWVEVYINGYWVPFDTINDHFANIPSNFLTVYYGDQVLFRHTANTNFKYLFKMNKRMVPRRVAQESLGETKFSLPSLFTFLERVGISVNLLKIILMIPLGALVTVFFRNVVGLETYGTFLPTLIAAAARNTGLLWGLAGFLFIILLSFIVRRGLGWLQLLHSPKMAIMLTVVVIFLLSVAALSVELGVYNLAQVTLFPIAILAITAERFATIEEEQGLKKALTMMAASLVVIAANYWVMDSQFLQSMMLAFQELLLVIIAINLWLGKWIGMRLVEFIRFRKLIWGAAK